MLFDIEEDAGRRIVFYLVPDSGGGTPTVRLRANGVDMLTLEANQKRPNLVAAGRHSTGRCGFAIDDALVPALATFQDLEIFERDTDVLVYRRRLPHVVEERIFRLETHLRPLARLDTALSDRFQYSYPGIDRFGHETASQAFCLDSTSIFISGHLLLKNFDNYLVHGVKAVGLIRDPLCELAERLLVFKQVGDEVEAVLGARAAMTFGPAIAHLEHVDIGDEAQCRRFFKRAPEPVLKALSNPLVRQLTTTAPDQMPGPSGVAAALDALAGFELLGLRSKADAFIRSLAELSQIDPTLLPAAEEDPEVAALADRLRGIQRVEDILEKDLEVFYVMIGAFDRVDA